MLCSRNCYSEQASWTILFKNHGVRGVLCVISELMGGVRCLIRLKNQRSLKILPLDSGWNVWVFYCNLFLILCLSVSLLLRSDNMSSLYLNHQWTLLSLSLICCAISFWILQAGCNSIQEHPCLIYNRNKQFSLSSEVWVKQWSPSELFGKAHSYTPAKTKALQVRQTKLEEWFHFNSVKEKFCKGCGIELLC